MFAVDLTSSVNFNPEEKRLYDAEDDEYIAALLGLKAKKTRSVMFVDDLSPDDVDDEGATRSAFSSSATDKEQPIEALFSYIPAHPFFEGKVKHATREIQILFTRIVLEASKKEVYQQAIAAKFLVAYENYAAAEPKTVADVNYDEIQERSFLEKILTVFLQEQDRFNTEFEFVRKGLVRGLSDSYAVTASKLKGIKMPIEGVLIDPVLEKGINAKDIEELINYHQLLQYI